MILDGTLLLLYSVLGLVTYSNYDASAAKLENKQHKRTTLPALDHPSVHADY